MRLIIEVLPDVDESLVGWNVNGSNMFIIYSIIESDRFLRLRGFPQIQAVHIYIGI